MEILRYDLDHGSVVPFSLISESGGSSVRTEPNEELCYWIPNSELEKFEKALANTTPPQIGHSRLLLELVVTVSFQTPRSAIAI